MKTFRQFIESFERQGSSLAKVPYKQMDMENIVKDAIGDMPEDDGPHTSKISDADAPNFKTFADPSSVVNQATGEGNRDAIIPTATRASGKPFKKLAMRRRQSYGAEDFSGAVASVATGA